LPKRCGIMGPRRNEHCNSSAGLQLETALVRGEALLLGTDDRPEQETEAEGCLREAIAVARRQRALMWELRATIALARLSARQDQPAEAHAMLRAVYGQFTEGFTLPDLCDARALLDNLQGEKAQITTA